MYYLLLLLKVIKCSPQLIFICRIYRITMSYKCRYEAIPDTVLHDYVVFILFIPYDIPAVRYFIHHFSIIQYADCSPVIRNCITKCLVKTFRHIPVFFTDIFDIFHLIVVNFSYIFFLYHLVEHIIRTADKVIIHRTIFKLCVHRFRCQKLLIYHLYPCFFLKFIKKCGINIIAIIKNYYLIF